MDEQQTPFTSIEIFLIDGSKVIVHLSEELLESFEKSIVEDRSVRIGYKGDEIIISTRNIALVKIKRGTTDDKQNHD